MMDYNNQQLVKEFTQLEVKEMLNYNPETGIFIWLTAKANCVSAGVIAGYKTHGYIKIGINNKKYPAHRLAWFYTYGVWPKDQLDHINHVRDDNRIVNLREATSQENSKNTLIRKDNTSGFIGVYWNEINKNWRVRISINGNPNNLGSFADKTEAINVRKAANTKYGYHKNHGVYIQRAGLEITSKGRGRVKV